MNHSVLEPILIYKIGPKGKGRRGEGRAAVHQGRGIDAGGDWSLCGGCYWED